MGAFEGLPLQIYAGAPRRLGRALPSVLLGTLFNVLDAGMSLTPR